VLVDALVLVDGLSGRCPLHAGQEMETMMDQKCEGGPIVLIIDDDPDFRALIRSYLVSEGYRVIDIDDGAKADAKVCSGCALIMVDLIMPGAEGIETIQRLRQEGVRTKILAISGASYWSEYLPLAMQLGADAACAKERLRQDLLPIVFSLLRIDSPSGVAATGSEIPSSKF
jgi:DNA-binding response OmpR family regulator